MIIIAGMGIGGTAAALALQKAGLDFVILEQASALGEVGAGLQMSPNAARIVGWLGLGEALAHVGVEPEGHLFIDWKSGETLMRTPLKPKVREFFGAPYFHVHRADLLDLLAAGVAPSRVRLDSEIVAVSQTQGAVNVTLKDDTVITGTALIAADGIHSVVREQIFRPDPPRNSGCIAWRGLVPIEFAQQLGYERNSYVWMGPERSVVMYYVRGGKLFNWVGVGPFNDNAQESWSAKGSNDAALSEYSNWNPRVLQLIAGTESLFMTSLADRDPLERWVDGRIALMGDAAHAMLPFHAQGAVQSIEDAWVIARCLQESRDNVQAALQKYERLRLQRANRVQHQSRTAEHLFHMSDPDEITRRNARFHRHEQEANDGFPPGQQWLFAYDAEKAVTGEDAEWRQLSW